MKTTTPTIGALLPRTRRARALQPPPRAPKPARLPFLDAWPEPVHDLLVLNPRPDLAPEPSPAAPFGAYLEVMLG